MSPSTAVAHPRADECRPQRAYRVLPDPGRLRFHGKLPDNLTFVAAGTSNPANVDTGTAAVLNSATLGQLTAAQIFHTFANLNPGHADQVLAGLAAGGHQLQIGFEDMSRTTGDNDFQDVVSPSTSRRTIIESCRSASDRMEPQAVPSSRT
jgi:hypothetical protein